MSQGADMHEVTLLKVHSRVVSYLLALSNRIASYHLEVDRISASVSVSAPNVDKWALSADIRFRPKTVVPHSVHFRFRLAAVGKFGGCRKSCGGRECAGRRDSLASLCTD